MSGWTDDTIFGLALLDQHDRASNNPNRIKKDSLGPIRRAVEDNRLETGPTTLRARYAFLSPARTPGPYTYSQVLRMQKYAKLEDDWDKGIDEEARVKYIKEFPGMMLDYYEAVSVEIDGLYESMKSRLRIDVNRLIFIYDEVQRILAEEDLNNLESLDSQ